MWVHNLAQEGSLEEVMATHFSYGCLENPMDRGAWWASSESRTRLKHVGTHATTIWQLAGGGGDLVVKLYLNFVTL